LDRAFEKVIKKIRPQIISLAECKMLPDNVLHSNIGNSYGDIYELQLRLAKESSLNQLDKANGGVNP
jgi:hypothetical protein